VKDRLLTLGLALAAFALFYALMAPKPANPQERPTRPISTEKGPNGYLALMRWLQAEGVEPVSLRERYGRLHELLDSTAPGGNLLITTTPHLQPPRNSEFGPLLAWISDGNTLLVVAGLSDTPEWSMGEGVDPEFMAHMEAMTGLTFIQSVAEDGTVAQAPADERAPEAEKKPEPTPEQQRLERQKARQAVIMATQKLDPPQAFHMVPNGPHPLLAGVDSVQALSEYPTSQWRAVVDEPVLLLELAQNRDSEQPVLWLRRYGDGQIVVSAYGSILTNKLLGEHDNARLLANIVEWSRAKGGKVIIDDAHQGLVAFYDAQAFFGDRRLHASLGWLVALWLIFVLGPQRLRAAGSGWNPVDITSFVRASGGFLARALRPAAAGQRLFENFFNDIRRNLGLPANGAPMWDWISARGAVPAGDIAQLQELHGDVLRGQRIDLSKLQNLLVQVRTHLS
jgi:hypothetical protein